MLKFSEKINSVPSFRPLVFVLLGVIIEDIIPAHYISRCLLFLLVAGILLYIFSATKFWSVQAYLIAAASVILSFFSAGFLVSMLNHTETTPPGKGIYLTEVTSVPVEKTSSYNLKLKLLKNTSMNYQYPEKFYINAYFPKKTKKELPAPGDVLLINSELNKNSNPGNPYEFDYAGYLDRQRIYSVIFLPDSCWHNTSIKSTIPAYRLFTLQIKQALQEKIKKIAVKTGNNHYPVLLAICTGDKSELKRETKELYSNAGAIHVMAVSGLHVGMIWMFLMQLTFFLKKSRSGRLLQFLIILGVLWLFALITGMSASVTRSCIMFSIASTARLIRKNSSIYNSLSVSAFIQIIINPVIIYDVGFQFSYLAVLSIVMFQPLACKIYSSRFYLPQKIFDLLSVSLSAQVLTFPLTVYYFHQFPVYFLLSNLFAIPLVTLMMISFLAAICLVFIPPASELLIIISLQLTGVMNHCISFVNSLPFHVLEKISLSREQAMMLLILSLMALHFRYYKKFFSLFASIAILSLFVQAGILNQSLKKKDRICILNIKDLTAIDISTGNNHNFYCTDTTSRMMDISRAVSGYWQKLSLHKPEYILLTGYQKLPGNFFRLPGENNYIATISGKKVALISDPGFLKDYTTEMQMMTDLLIMGGSGYSPRIWSKLLDCFDTNYLILDSSIPHYYPGPDIPDSFKGHFHRVSERGAFLLDL